MDKLRPSLAFFILLYHFACFIHSPHLRRCRRHSSLRLKNKLSATKTSLVSFLKHLFSSSSGGDAAASFPNPSCSPVMLLIPLSPSNNGHPHNSQPAVNSPTSLVCRDNIHPCSVCGEIFQSSSLLELHHSTNHAVSDLIDGENILRIIFKTGWPNKKAATIHRILKIHNHPTIITRFEEYRESVKSRAAAAAARDERCIADGNELLRFHCTTLVCELDSSICRQQWCSLCGIIRAGFSPKMDGIATLGSSYDAHLSLPEGIEEEFKFMHVRRALLVCRVIAGRVGCEPSKGDSGGFDSLMGSGNGGDQEDELLVYNPRAVLPCFVILYTM